jgi:predicted LPLAT superfamily acyltransferase
VTVAWKAQQERGNRLMIGLMAWVARSLGRAVARALLFPVCLYYLIRSTEANHALRQYYVRAQGRSPSWSDLFHHYYWFASTILDRVYFLRGRFDRFAINIRGIDILDRALRGGRGCLLLGSHLGSFEVVRAVGLSREHIEVKVLMDEKNAPLIRGLMHNLNPAVAGTVIQVGGIDSMLRVQECLERGGVVGIMGDRLMSQDQCVRCDFLGSPAPFPTGSMRLAHVTGAPVVLFFGLYRGGNRYEVQLELLGECIRMAPEQPDEQMQRWIQRYADRLAHYSREATDNWFNFYDFWQAPH